MTGEAKDFPFFGEYMSDNGLPELNPGKSTEGGDKKF